MGEGESGTPHVLRVGSVPHPSLVDLAGRYGLRLVHRGPTEDLPGSYWGDSEAGLRGNQLYVRADTPLHSLLHELSHFVCMAPERRAALDRDAGGDDDEECAVCYLQIVLAAWTPGLTPSGWVRRSPGLSRTPATPASGCVGTACWTATTVPLSA
jgi:hypothetical protein